MNAPTPTKFLEATATELAFAIGARSEGPLLAENHRSLGAFLTSNSLPTAQRIAARLNATAAPTMVSPLESLSSHIFSFPLPGQTEHTYEGQPQCSHPKANQNSQHFESNWFNWKAPSNVYFWPVFAILTLGHLDIRSGLASRPRLTVSLKIFAVQKFKRQHQVGRRST